MFTPFFCVYLIVVLHLCWLSVVFCVVVCTCVSYVCVCLVLCVCVLCACDFESLPVVKCFARAVQWVEFSVLAVVRFVSRAACDGFSCHVDRVRVVLVEDCHGRWDDGERDGLDTNRCWCAQLKSVCHHADWFAVDVYVLGCDGDVCVWRVGQGVLLGCG